MEEEANTRGEFQLEDGSKLTVEPTEDGLVLIHLEGCGTWEFTPSEVHDLKAVLRSKLDQIEADITQHEMLASLLRSAT